jgi:ABC-type multidrug transport system fused ATPase/permease subunit
MNKLYIVCLMSSIFSNVFSKYESSISDLDANIAVYDSSMISLYSSLQSSVQNEDFSYNEYEKSEPTITYMNSYLSELTEDSNNIHDTIVEDISNTDFLEHAEFITFQHEKLKSNIRDYNSKIDEYNSINDEILTNKKQEKDTQVFRNYMLMISWFFITCIILVIALLTIFESTDAISIYTRVALIFIVSYIIYIIYKYYTIQKKSSDLKQKVKLIIHRKKDE